MTFATKYGVQIAWRTIAKDVFQLTRETVNDPATYRMTVAVIDSNNPGAGQKEIGYYLVDFWGVPYLIIGTGSTYVDVQDDFRVGRCPTSGRMAVIFKSVYNGRALHLGQIDFQHLHPLAFSNYQRYASALIWANDPNAKKVPFTASAFPKIINYQTDQVDPEDATKTINYAEDFGENPNIRLVISVDATNGYQQQQMVLFTYVGGLIDTAGFDVGEGNEISGYISISRS